MLTPLWIKKDLLSSAGSIKQSLRKPPGAVCFIYWGNNSISCCLQTKQGFQALHPGEIYSKQTENFDGLVLRLVVYLIFQHKSSTFTWLTILFTEHDKRCADRCFSCSYHVAQSRTKSCLLNVILEDLVPESSVLAARKLLLFM